MSVAILAGNNLKQLYQMYEAGANHKSTLFTTAWSHRQWPYLTLERARLLAMAETDIQLIFTSTSVDLC